MRSNYFKITEFLIDPNMRDGSAKMPVHVADKLVRFHLPILNQLRSALDSPIYISKHSGYRPSWWEKQHGRSGGSEHTFHGKGAVDLQVDNYHIDPFHQMLLESEYARIAWYPENTFWHCDFGREDNKKLYFVNKSDGWAFQHYRN